MHILLININPVVSRLLSLCIREKHISLEEIHSVHAITSRENYDILFIDEASYTDTDETKEVLTNLTIGKKVFLTSTSKINNKEKLFDIIIKKPFLPSQIIEILEEEDLLTLNRESPSFPLSFSKQEERKESALVLDTNEIEKIKILLETEDEIETVSDEDYESRKREVIKQQLIADGLEIVDEDEYIESLSKRSKPYKEEKRTKEQKVKKTTLKNKKTSKHAEVLLATIMGMKVKKIKKLLKGAEITIKINFKDKK